MCGRYTHRLTWEQLVALYRLIAPAQGEPDLRPRYNAAPTDILPVVRLDKGGNRELVMLRWGLIPFWAKDTRIGSKFINARAETVATAPAFRAAFKTRRCLVPASGFYEWKKIDGGKQPYHIGMRDGAPFAFDIRGDKAFADCLAPDSYVASQGLAQQLLEAGSLGVVYPSVRKPGGTCVACFRPTLVMNVRKDATHVFRWKGEPEPIIRIAK